LILVSLILHTGINAQEPQINQSYLCYVKVSSGEHTLFGQREINITEAKKKLIGVKIELNNKWVTIDKIKECVLPEGYFIEKKARELRKHHPL